MPWLKSGPAEFNLLITWNEPSLLIDAEFRRAVTPKTGVVPVVATCLWN